jgi:hypothetical protein
MKPFVLRYEERNKHWAITAPMPRILNSEAHSLKVGPQTGTYTLTEIKSESVDTDRATCGHRIFHSKSV